MAALISKMFRQRADSDASIWSASRVFRHNTDILFLVVDRCAHSNVPYDTGPCVLEVQQFVACGTTEQVVTLDVAR